jgi:hypothetical protein
MKIHPNIPAVIVLLTIAGWASVTPAEARRLNFMDGIGYQQRLKESREAYAAAWAAQQQQVAVKRSVKKKKGGTSR